MTATTSSSIFDTVTRRLVVALRVDHLVVEIVRQRVGDRQQQAVGRRQRRRETAGRHQPGDDVRQAGDLGRGEHDDVGAEHDFGELHDAVPVDVGDRQQRWDRPAPSSPPRPASCAKLLPTRKWIDVEFRQHRQRGRGEIQQEDEEQRPEHRLARLRARSASCSSASGCAAARRCRTSCRTRCRGSCCVRCSAPPRPLRRGTACACGSRRRRAGRRGPCPWSRPPSPHPHRPDSRRAPSRPP